MRPSVIYMTTQISSKAHRPPAPPPILFMTPGTIWRLEKSLRLSSSSREVEKIPKSGTMEKNGKSDRGSRPYYRLT